MDASDIIIGDTDEQERRDRIRQLVALGLTENQAKVYVALLRTGRSNAAPLGKAAGVPRNKVYSVLDELNKRGLVEIILADPIQVEARPIDEHLRMLMHEFDERRSLLLASIDDLEAQFPIEPPIEPDQQRSGTLRLIRGRNAVTRQHLRMNAEAKELVQVFAGANAAARTRNARSLDAYPAGEGTNVRREVFLNHAPDQDEALAWLHERMGDELHITDAQARNLLVKIVDGKEVFINHSIPDSTSATTGDDVAIWTDNPVFVHMAEIVMAHAREKAVPFSEHVRRVAGGTEPEGAA